MASQGAPVVVSGEGNVLYMVWEDGRNGEKSTTRISSNLGASPCLSRATLYYRHVYYTIMLPMILKAGTP